MSDVIMRREDRGTDTHGTDGLVTTEAETGVIQPQARNARSPQRLGGTRRHPALETLEGLWSYSHLPFRLPGPGT